MKAFKTRIIIILLLIFSVCGLSGCSSNQNTEDLNQPSVKIGAEYGNMTQENLEICYPNAEAVYMTSVSDGVQQLLSGQIDALLDDTAELEKAAMENPSIEISDIKFPIDSSVVVAISDKAKAAGGQDLLNEFLQEMEDNGTLAEMEDRWENKGDLTMPEIPKAEDPSGTILIGTTCLAEPYTFYSGTDPCGFDIELAERFALWAGMDYTFRVYDWNGIYTALEAGAVDYVFSDLYYQDNAADTICFSQPYRHATCSLATIRNQSVFTMDTFLSQLYNNLIAEGRWKMLLDGFGVTIILTVLSALFGCLLGFILALGKRSKCRPLKAVLNAVTHVIRSVPLLVLLMILYYVIFKDLNSLTVAVIAFSINFAAFISDTFVSCIDGVGKGQWEAAQSLGFTERKTFTRVIMPQALRTFLPAFTSQVIGLMLLTSVVGYISVIDVTFAAQMIRTRTYSSLYTLLFTAVLYFLLATLLNLALRCLRKQLIKGRDPLRGINTDITVSGELFRDFRKTNKTDETVIEAEGLTKVYPGAVPLKDLTCSVKSGELITIIGPSGTGKSTLLRCICRLEEPSAGSVKIFGTEVSKGKPDHLRDALSRTGMVFQNFNLFEHLTVIENVMLAPVLVRRKSRQEAYETALTLLSALGLRDKILEHPENLSGGQRQRTAIARAMAMDPDILFFDEPTSALDSNMVGEVITVLKKLSELGMTILVITHDMRLVQAISTRVWYLDRGILYEEGSADQILHNPETDLCRIFVRQIKTLRLEITEHHIDLPGIVSTIDEFGVKYGISKAAVHKLYQIAEEMMIGMILNLGYQKAKCSVEYDPVSGNCTAEILYEGNQMNILDLTEGPYKLNIQMIRQNLSEVHYCAEGQINKIRMTF